jgi:hypothetical protein
LRGGAERKIVSTSATDCHFSRGRPIHVNAAAQAFEAVICLFTREFTMRKHARRSARQSGLPKHSHKAEAKRRRRLHMERLEDRRMMAIGWTWNASTGHLEGRSETGIFGSPGEVIKLGVNPSTGEVTDGGIGLRAPNNQIPLSPQPLASQVKTIYIRTRRGDDVIDLRDVNSTTFPNIAAGTSIKLEGDWGVDTIFGSQYADKILGDLGGDKICGMGGSDEIFGGYGQDTICGGEGSDYIEGQDNDDRILGEGGNDHIIGGGGNDIMDGGPGNDILDAKTNSVGLARDTIYTDGADDIRSNKGFLGIGKDRVRPGPSDIVCECDAVVDPPMCIYETDFGDAPDSFRTYLHNDGARHQITAIGPRMGTFIDADGNGLPSVNADHDDSFFGRDDEDGVVFLGGNSLPASPSLLTKSVRIDVQNLLPTETARLDAWIDFDGDGDFGVSPGYDTNNRIFNNVTVTPGLNTLTFTVPYTGSQLGPTYARFRISPAGTPSVDSFGLIIGGEVEDYLVSVDCSCAMMIAPGVTGYQCEAATPASFVSQLNFITNNVWGMAEASHLTFDELSGAFSGETYAASHGIHFQNLRGPGALAEGGSPLEHLDGYDGEWRPDGNTVVASINNHLDPPLTITFDEPAFAVGSFIATGVEGTPPNLRIQAFDALDNLLATYDPPVFTNGNPDNNEGMWALESLNVGISKVTIKNLNPVDFGNVLIFDDLQWLPFEPQPTVLDFAAEFEDVFNTGDAIAVIDFNDVAGPVDPNAYLGSHGVTIEGVAQLHSLPEGTGPIGTVDGYDSSYESDGDRMLSATGGNELSFIFTEPVLSVGMFLADEPDPLLVEEINGDTGYTMRVFGVDGTLIDAFNTDMFDFANGQNDEGFVYYPNSPNDVVVPIGKVTLTRNSDQADPFKVDNLTFTRAIAPTGGDYNGDGVGNAADYVVWRKTLGQTGPGLAADGDGDLDVDQADYQIWYTNFGSAAPAAAPGNALSLASNLAEAVSTGHVATSSSNSTSGPTAFDLALIEWPISASAVNANRADRLSSARNLPRQLTAAATLPFMEGRPAGRDDGQSETAAKLRPDDSLSGFESDEIWQVDEVFSDLTKELLGTA